MAADLFDVTSKVVVITGGLGQLGSQFARTLLARGAAVAALDLPGQVARAGDVFGEWTAHERLACIACDVTKRDSLESALEETKRRLGVPAGLINNAALDSPPSASGDDNPPFERYSEHTFDLVMDVNVKGVFLCCQVFGGAMAEVGRGSIININSIYGLVSPDQRIYDFRRRTGVEFYKPIGYSVSKSALLNLTRYLATYWADRGVRVNNLTFAGVFNHQDPQFLEAYCARVPLGRMARADEYNGAIVFMLSDAASYMTGSNLVLDGGWTSW